MTRAINSTVAAELLKIARVALRRVPARVLILTASVGEGHDRPALWLAEQLRAEQPETVVLVEDSLRVMGRVVAILSEGGPRVFFYRLRWFWDFAFWVVTRPSPARALAQRLLTRFGSPGLLALIERSRADVVVSVFPQASEVLARLRRSGRLQVPFLSGITDVAAMDYWACRGADTYLVTQPEAISEVRQIAGADADVHTVTGFTDPAFYAPRSRADARRALGLDPDGTIVLVSGGGWGVGDIEGAVVESLGVSGVHVVCLTGRNDELRARLTRRFAGEPRVRIEGFTEVMGEWLAAGDALVHSTGGLTVLEAMLRGCPVISYGWGRGHIRKHNEVFQRYGLADVVKTRSELRAALERALAGGRTETSGFSDLRSGASFVLAAADAR
jgi:processive 1,2-diacylglycerol beta-glucosyltransferase